MNNPSAITNDDLQKLLEDKAPMAAVAFRVMAFGFADDLLLPLWEAHRGRRSDRNVTFRNMMDWVLEALTQAGGSGSRVFVDDQLQQRERPGDRSSYYRKLAGQPPALSRDLLKHVATRLKTLWPDDAPPMNTVPACFDRFTPVIFDGKKIKRGAKRTKALRGFAGSLLAAKALVATEVRTGLAVAMSSSLDGETNDVPLTDELVPQVRALFEDAVLYLADRQFGCKAVLDDLASREGDAYAVRVGKAVTFTPDADCPHNQGKSSSGTDDQGRAYRDEIGTLFKGGLALRTRRIHLDRGGRDDVMVVTNLTDAAAYPAADLLTLYRRRWGIENVFQDVTETFGLERLIGSTPEASLFQFALCTSIYNVHQVIRCHAAVAGRAASDVSTIREVSCKQLHRLLVREMTGWLVVLSCPQWRAETSDELREALREMGTRVWNRGLISTMDRPGYVRKKSPEFRVHGGHTSVKRLTDLTEEQRARVRRTGRVRKADLTPS